MPVRVGSVRVPVFVIDDMIGAVSVLLVSVSVPASVANVPVTIGNVIVGVPAAAGVTIAAEPDVLPVTLSCAAVCCVVVRIPVLGLNDIFVELVFAVVIVPVVALVNNG